MTDDTPREVQLVEQALLAHHIEPRTRWFEASTATAVEAAAALGVDVGAIANSLVFLVDDEVIMIIASGAHRVDTSLLGESLGGSITRASAGTVKRSTGQIVGGVAPIGHPERLRTLVDVSLATHELVWVSAGHPHAVFPTTFAELLRLTGGTATVVALD